MNGPIERCEHVRIIQRDCDGVTQTEVRVSSTAYANTPADSSQMPRADFSGDCAELIARYGDCFDPETCCDEREKALIKMMRAYLRPQQAPECLLERLHATLDHCCCDERKQRHV